MDHLHRRLRRALDLEGPLDALADARPGDERDALLTLLELYALHVAPLDAIGPRVRHQHHPALAALRARLEEALEADLDARAPAAPDPDPVRALRALAADDLVPPVYDWLAEDATLDEVREALALEGGPDGGFDDLVAVAQVGLDGLPKLTLAENYWDEMGDGDARAVHTQLHRDLVRALRLPTSPADALPVEALRRQVLGGLVTVNRRLQPEAIGALGLLELQAGPRCRRVLSALERLDVPESARRFYQVHADTDPVHGREWLTGAVAPLADRWGDRMVRGARWRAAVNRDFFAMLNERCARRVVAA